MMADANASSSDSLPRTSNTVDIRNAVACITGQIREGTRFTNVAQANEYLMEVTKQKNVASTLLSIIRDHFSIGPVTATTFQAPDIPHLLQFCASGICNCIRLKKPQDVDCKFFFQMILETCQIARAQNVDVWLLKSLCQAAASCACHLDDIPLDTFVPGIGTDSVAIFVVAALPEELERVKINGPSKQLFLKKFKSQVLIILNALAATNESSNKTVWVCANEWIKLASGRVCLDGIAKSQMLPLAFQALSTADTSVRTEVLHFLEELIGVAAVQEDVSEVMGLIGVEQKCPKANSVVFSEMRN